MHTRFTHGKFNFDIKWLQSLMLVDLFNAGFDLKFLRHLELATMSYSVGIIG